MDRTQRDSVVMHPQYDAKIDPLKSKAKFTKALRSAILSIVPYRGVLGVTFPDVASPSDADKSLRYTIDRASLPRGLMPARKSADRTAIAFKMSGVSRTESCV